MNEVVLIRCLDEWMVFYCPVAVTFSPGGVRTLGFLYDFFLVAILGGFWVPKGIQNPLKIDFFAKKGMPGNSFLTTFAARGVRTGATERHRACERT